MLAPVGLADRHIGTGLVQEWLEGGQSSHGLLVGLHSALYCSEEAASAILFRSNLCAQIMRHLCR